MAEVTAERRCRQCGWRNIVTTAPGFGDAEPSCSKCGAVFPRRLVFGQDRALSAPAPGWPSGQQLDAERNAAYDAFLRPRKGGA